MSTIITPLLHTFSSALTTNAFLHLLSKASLTLITFLLHAHLPPTAFSLWATTQSIIFLLVLWLDFGLRRSIPRYAPLFGTQRHQLLQLLLPLQFLFFLIGIPLLAHLLSAPPLTLLLAIGIYLTESLVSILRSLYHAFFYHRPFNQYATHCTVADTLLTILLIFCTPTTSLIPAIFLVRCLTNSILIVIALIQWHQQLPPYSSGTNAQQVPSLLPFLRHSFAMWCTTLLTSISERNFLLPFIIYSSTIHTGIMFKLANDGALLFYRFIIKTIGSADTALLAHVNIYHATKQEQYLMQQSLQKITTQITRLACPLLGIIICSIPIGYLFYNNQLVFHAFLIMAIGYVLETICIPYERLLEVKENYKILSYIYMLYTLCMISIFFLFYMTWIGFIFFIISIHGVRLVIGLLMRYSVYMIYGL